MFIAAKNIFTHIIASMAKTKFQFHEILGRFHNSKLPADRDWTYIAKFSPEIEQWLGGYGFIRKESALAGCCVVWSKTTPQAMFYVYLTDNLRLCLAIQDSIHGMCINNRTPLDEANAFMSWNSAHHILSDLKHQNIIAVASDPVKKPRKVSKKVKTEPTAK